MNRNVGRIVPKRYSLVTSMIPASAEKIPARLPTPSTLRWSSTVVRSRRLVTRPESSANSRTRATIPSTIPIVVRVERIFSSSALTGAIKRGSADVRSRKIVLERGAFDDELVHRNSGSEGDVADALACRAVHEQRSPLLAVASICSRSQRLLQLRRLGRADADRAADARGQLLERRLDHELAAVDDQHLVDGLGDLGEHVARDEHGPLPGREPAQEIAQPADTLGVEPVCRLVEDQQLGIAEQRSREAEPLAHPERVALHASARRTLEIDEPQHLVDARVGQRRRSAERPQMVATRTAGWKSVASSTAPTRSAGRSSSE